MFFGKTTWGSSKAGGKGPAGDAGSLRVIGDRFRDAGKKAEAAEAYGEHLALEPNDFEIWVQRGKCLKDTGQHAAALMAYERAVVLRPDDADVYLQMGHANKLNGSRKKAIEAYNLALEKQPTLYAAANELQRLGARLPALRSPLDEIHAAGRPARPTLCGGGTDHHGAFSAAGGWCGRWPGSTGAPTSDRLGKPGPVGG